MHIFLKGGIPLTQEEAAQALNEAFTIIEKIGTTEADCGETLLMADEWIRKYYPSWK